MLCWVWVCGTSIFYWFTTPTVVRTGATCSQHVWEESSLRDYRSWSVRFVVGLLDTWTSLWIWPLVTLYVYSRGNKLQSIILLGFDSGGLQMLSSWMSIWGTDQCSEWTIWNLDGILSLSVQSIWSVHLTSVLTLYHEQLFKEDTLREPVSSA